MTSPEFPTPLTVIEPIAQRLIKLKDRLAPATCWSAPAGFAAPYADRPIS